MVDHRADHEEVEDAANTVVAPLAAANPAVLVATAGACHVLTAAILLYVRLAFEALGDHVA